VANLSKTVHINFYQNRSSIVEVMIKNFGVFYASQCRTHSVLLAPVSGSLPLLDELACHCVRFIGNCLDSENNVVSHVARYAMFSGRTCSPLGLNAQFCCGRYNKALNDLQNISKTSIWQHVRSSQSQSVTNTANVIAELLMVKSGYAVLPIWSNFEVDRCIEELCLL